MCPHCKSKSVECLNWYSVQIAIDDAYDVSQMLCKSCGYEWDE